MAEGGRGGTNEGKEGKLYRTENWNKLRRKKNELLKERERERERECTHSTLLSPFPSLPHTGCHLSMFNLPATRWSRENGKKRSNQEQR